MRKLIVYNLIFFLKVLLVRQKNYGKEIDIRDYPFVVSVMVKKEVDYLHNGGGTIIRLDITLTSCRVVAFLDSSDRTQPLESKNIVVTAGTDRIYDSNNANQQVRQVMKNALNERCDLAKATFDLAVLTLGTPFTETEFVKPSQIFSWVEDSVRKAFDRLIEFRAECQQVLWSEFLQMDLGPAEGPWLTVGKVTIVPPAHCRKYFCIFSNTLCDHPFEENGQFCAVAQNGTVPCLEDLGSPLVCHGSLFGMVTFGSCSTCKPSVYISQVTIIGALQDYSPEKFSAALTIRRAKVFSEVGILRYFLPTLMAVYRV